MAIPSSLPAWRIAIAGGGLPGLTLALAVVRRLGPAVAVTIHDPALARERADPRAYALSAATSRFLEGLGIGALPLQPIGGMAITDSRLADAVRPTYLRFEAEGGTPLGHMVEAEPLAAALRAACLEAGVRLDPAAVSAFVAGPERILVTTPASTGNAALLVACDGARSRLRETAGIGWVGRRYRQAGIVATIGMSRDHGGWATQHFMPSGPFAILPLPDGPAGHRASIVWTEREDRARAILALPPEAIRAELEARCGPAFGTVTLLTPPASHPLSVGLARSFVANRLALVGDAAHEIHPLAGQGLNRAFADAEALATRIAGSVRLGLDPGRSEVLVAYQRDRRFDAVALAATTDALNGLFSNDRLPFRVLRDIGLGLVDRAPGAKRFFARQAAGARRVAGADRATDR